MMRYIRPKSLTWWLGFAAIMLGGLGVLHPEINQITRMGQLVGYLIGLAEPTAPLLIVIGGGLVGLRDKLERALPEGYVLVDSVQGAEE